MYAKHLLAGKCQMSLWICGDKDDRVAFIIKSQCCETISTLISPISTKRSSSFNPPPTPSQNQIYYSLCSIHGFATGKKSNFICSNFDLQFCSSVYDVRSKKWPDLPSLPRTDPYIFPQTEYIVRRLNQSARQLLWDYVLTLSSTSLSNSQRRRELVEDEMGYFHSSD